MLARALVLGACAFMCAAASSAPVARGANGPNLELILAERPPVTLAAYRLFLDAGARSPNEGVIAYELPTPLFSDDAVKRRYVFVPPGARAAYAPEGAFEFPVGSVLIKTFEYPADLRTPEKDVRKIETRLLIRGRAGWTANTYVWNDTGDQARLEIAGATTSVRLTTREGVSREIAYAIPNRNQCKGCHSVDGALTPIGPSAAHLDDAAEGARETELARWVRLGVVGGAPPPGPPVQRALEQRARAYLDINCAHCHNPRGAANTSGLDLRAAQSDPARWGLRKRPIAAGRASADMFYAIDPGHPERSILLHRMESVDPGVMMPELGRTTTHTDGVALVRAWIAEMDADGHPRQN